MYTIYRIRNVQNGKRYIGQTGDPQRREHSHLSNLRHGKHPSKHLQKAWAKYGPASFVFEILFTCSTQQQLDDCERELLTSLPREMLYNAFLGVHRGRGPNTAETKARMAAAKRGVPRSPEARAAVSAGMKGHPFWGNHKQSPETIEKKRASRAGYRHSDETKAQMRETALRRVEARRLAQSTPSQPGPCPQEQ